MKAWIHHRYGPPDVLSLEEGPTPVPGDGELLVRVRAASLNPYDWHFLRGDPRAMRGAFHGIRGPREGAIPGADVAGVVEAVGPGVTRFHQGDEVYGQPGAGGLAEYVSVKQDAAVFKPEGTSFEQASGLPMVSLTALQGLRDHGRLREGQRVLIIGAGGGIGTMAIQIAALLGAGEIVAVCSASKADLVRSLGADRVVDYASEDVTRSGERFDLVFDTVGYSRISSLRRTLTPRSTLVPCGGGSPESTFGPLPFLARATLMRPFIRQRIAIFVAKTTLKDLEHINELVGTGELTPIVGQTFPFTEAPDAFRLLEEGHATGKIVVAM
jgi:NADPH:quinone reductase-like Zn-dependent oxidoreductase